MHSMAFIKAYLCSNNIAKSPLLTEGLDFENGGYAIDSIVEDRKEKLIKFFDTSLNWPGCVIRNEECGGELQYNADYAKLLSSKDLVVYAGHGCGSHYMSLEKLHRLLIRSGVLLMGCSSVEHRFFGLFEGYGPPCAYLLSGCPFVIGTLWDVTDWDTDRFTAHVLRKWAEEASDPKADLADVSAMIASAREKCVLKYANGAAFVAYGIPIKLRKGIEVNQSLDR